MSILWYSSTQQMLANLPGGWFSMSMIVVSIIMLFLALLYMVSKIFSVPTLDRKIKEEFFQLGATILILIILFGIETSGGLILGSNQHLDDLLKSMSGYYVVGKGMQVNTFDVVYVYLISTIDCLRAEFSSSANSINKKETWLMTSLSLSVTDVGIPLPLKTIYVVAGLWEDILDSYISAEEAMWLSLAAYFQINLLQWIEASMFAVYLPLGILLRAIPFTRGGGAGLIAISITAYFFFPFFLAIFYFNGPQLPNSCSVELEVETSQTSQEDKKCPLDPTAVGSLFAEDGGGIDFSPRIPVLDVSGLSRVKMYAFFYPFLSLLICIIIARAIGQIFGGNISDIGRGMVKVI